jgi:hypothetical protein
LIAPRVCPECGEEYLPTVLRCVDCGVSLEAGAPARADEAAELPPAAQLVLVRSSSLAIAQGLSERLSEAGITHRIQVVPDAPGGDDERPRPAAMPYGVYVREADAAEALAVDREYLRSQLPDLPADAEAGAEGGCPACGAPVAADAAECPDCGLALLGPS